MSIGLEIPPRVVADGVSEDRREEPAITSLRRSSAGVPPLSKADPGLFEALAVRYAGLFDPYLDALVIRRRPPRNEMRAIVAMLAERRAAPADLMALHTRALTTVVRGVGPARTDGYRNQGRLLALEMMGYLADLYRQGAGGPTAEHDRP